MIRYFGIVLLMFAGLAGSPLCAHADGSSSPCSRPDAGTVVAEPPDLYSQDGVLDVSLTYYTSVDDAGRTLFCLVTPDGKQSPTLHVHPGETLNLSVTNANPPAPPGSPTEVLQREVRECGDSVISITSLNLHFHGTNTQPKCHSDQVIETVINSGQSFRYSIKIPANEPPGLYWYHPHIHHLSEAALQGGASGAIVVEGIENIQPAVAGLPARLLMIRDQVLPSSVQPSDADPAWDVSLNYVPVPSPTYTPGIIEMEQGRRELWRVANASADTIVDLQLNYDGVAQPLEVVALDGVPTGSMDGTRGGKIVKQTHILLTPAARAEFIVTGPPPGVKNAILTTLNVDTGPDGDNDPPRPLATIRAASPALPLPIIPQPSQIPGELRFEELHHARVTANRTLYFSEVISDPSNSASPTNFFITVDGATPVLFDANNPPAIVTRQGDVEDWTIENRSRETHVFHIHQIHFLVLERDGVAVPPDQRQFLDTTQVPYRNGSGPFPGVKVRMDFRGMDVGKFVYHCHILGHEDNGMMAIIRVLPRDHWEGRERSER